MKTDCFGWWADRIALDNACELCRMKESCKKVWAESGGRMGGYFDRAKEARI